MEARFSVPVKTMGIGSLPELNSPRGGVDHRNPSRTEVKERVSYISTSCRRLHGRFLGELSSYA